MSYTPARTLWPDLSARLVARMLSAHAGIGAVLGGLLYIVSLSGVLVVFHAEFARWEQPDAPEYASVSPALVQTAAEAALADAQAAGVAPDRIMVYLPTPDSPRLVAGYGDTYRFVHSDGSLGAEVEHGFSEFLIDLHYYLHLPSTLGLIVVGLLGVMMLALVLSGFLAHPRVFRDAFRTAPGTKPQLALSDRHNRLSVWGAPFHVMIPLTGAALGLATLVAVALAATDAERDAAALFDTVFGAPQTAPAPAGPLPDIATAITNLQADSVDTGLTPWIVQVFNPGQDGQHLQMIAATPDRLTFGEYVQFDAAGAIIGRTGLNDGAFGKQATASVYNLHFGNWGGIWIKTAYVVLGLALCVVCVSGVQLWLLKRARKRGAQPALERAWTVLVWAPPGLIGLCLTLDRLAGLPDAALPLVFWGGLLALTALAPMLGDKARLSIVLRAAGGSVIVLGALSHFAAYGPTGYAAPPAWGVMGAMVLSGAALMASAVWRGPANRARQAAAQRPGDGG